jgi:hypothetical protein
MAHLDGRFYAIRFSESKGSVVNERLQDSIDGNPIQVRIGVAQVLNWTEIRWRQLIFPYEVTLKHYCRTKIPYLSKSLFS